MASGSGLFLATFEFAFEKLPAKTQAYADCDHAGRNSSAFKANDSREVGFFLKNIRTPCLFWPMWQSLFVEQKASKKLAVSSATPTPTPLKTEHNFFQQLLQQVLLTVSSGESQYSRKFGR